MVDEELDPDLAGFLAMALPFGPYKTALPVARMRIVRLPSPLSVTR